MDDFEIYLRAQTYETKLSRTIQKFVNRIKWLPITKRYQIFKEAHIRLKGEREQWYSEAIMVEDKIRKRFD